MAKETVEELQKFLPKSIDDVVRENRDKLRLALATENELKALETTIADAPVRHQLAGWSPDVARDHSKRSGVIPSSYREGGQ